MSECSTLYTCSACVPSCWWTTLFNSSKICVHDLARLGIPYTTLVSEPSGCPPEDNEFDLFTAKLFGGIGCAVGLTVLGVGAFAWCRGYLHRRRGTSRYYVNEQRTQLLPGNFQGSGRNDADVEEAVEMVEFSGNENGESVAGNEQSRPESVIGTSGEGHHCSGPSREMDEVGQQRQQNCFSSDSRIRRMRQSLVRKQETTEFVEIEF